MDFKNKKYSKHKKGKRLKTNFKFDSLSGEKIFNLFLEIFSFILSIKGETNNLHFLLLSLLATAEKYVDEFQFKGLKKFIYFIMAFENMNFNFQFNPEKLNKALLDNKINYESRIKDIKELILYWFGMAFLFLDDKDILNNANFEHFLISCLIAKFKTGFILDFNTPGLTKFLKSELNTAIQLAKEKCSLF